MRKLAILFFLTVLSIGTYAQQNKGRMSDLNDNYGTSDNEIFIPLILLIILGGMVLYGLITDNSKRKK